MFSMEQVTKSDADILCASHQGFIAEIDQVGLNYWLKSQLIEKYTPDRQPASLAKAGVPWGNLFWLGAVTQEHHDDHVNGNWLWPHANVAVEWFDWGDNEPNDFHSQNCLTFMEYRNVIFQDFRDYFWNDSDCKEDVAHYICVKECADCEDPTSPPPAV